MTKKAIALWACLLIASVSCANINHTVKEGENDITIAKKYNIPVDQLHELNPNIDWNKLQIGCSLTISAEKTNKPKPTATHKVVKGDNDYAVAKKYGLSVAQLQALNPGVSLDPLRLGTVLNVTGAPKKVESKPAPKPESNKLERVEIAKDNVILRSTPSTSASRKALLEKGLVAKVVDQKSDWVKIQFMSGTSGWVHIDLVKETTVALTLPSPKSTPVARAAAKPKSTSSNPAVASIIRDAYGCIGVRYVYGGTSRAGFDCSGFVGHVFRMNGINLPRTAAQQWGRGTPVAKSDLRAGDLLFFRTRGTGISHVGIYVGNNRFVHASSGGGRVRENELSGYYIQRYAGARRLVPGGDSYAINYSSLPIVQEPKFDPEPEAVKPKTPMGADTISK